MVADGLEDRTDLGLPADLDADQLAELRRAADEAERARRWREANLPSGPTATERVIERERARFGVARSRRTLRLLACCPRCNASSGRWCRGRFNHLCAERPEVDG